MAKRKPTNKYYFSVEGETEQWYLKWLQDLINNTEESVCKVSIDCPVALRRTLELVLKDKGATKWGLKDKIEEIAEKGILPDTLKEASSLTKILGDSAAHDKEIDIEQQDVESMAEFVEYIIEYLYVVPDKINSYKQRLSSKTDKSE